MTDATDLNTGRVIGAGAADDFPVTSARQRAGRFAVEIGQELRWSFTRPMTWLTGVGVNLAMSAVWLLWQPLTGRPRADWVVLIGTYFATFVLADVTTTNVLGPDTTRIRHRLHDGWSIQRVLLVKNFALLTIVGMPTMVIAAVLTVTSHDSYSLAVTLPSVAFPILVWLGVGDIVSVLLAVRPIPLRQRWNQRRDLPNTLRWLVHLALPYGLLYLVQPLGGVPRTILHQLARASRTPGVRGLVLAATATAIWLLGLLASAYLVRRRGLRIR